MAQPYLWGKTLDDLMHVAIEEILQRGEKIKATKGGAIEITGVLLELLNPRARLSRTEMRGKPYSCLGELCWFLSKSNRLDFILYYIRAYKKYADGEEIHGGYGPRLFRWKDTNQVENVIRTLTKKKSSRQAVVQLFDALDIVKEYKDVPCTCTMQFMIRDDRLHMFTYMRSNDAWLGLPHDIFCFTMLQEIIARSLSVELGPYKHSVGSFHLYDDSVDNARRYLAEGWQSTLSPMPPMPVGDPWPSIASLLGIESSLRMQGEFHEAELENINSYWADLARLLQVFSYKKKGDTDKIKEVLGRMSSNVYSIFIHRIIKEL